jgi:magnesium chelatase family protein
LWISTFLESNSVVRARADAARVHQIARQGKPNAALSPDEIELHCLPDCAGAALLKQALTRLDLSARAYHRILKVARTIADLSSDPIVRGPHVAEAIQYRRGLGG